MDTLQNMAEDRGTGTSWYAVRTRSRHEKLVDSQLQALGLTSFLPVITKEQRWSDRKKIVEFPLFSGYTFVRISAAPEERVRVLRTQGVVDFVGVQGRGIPIPDPQIEHVRAIMASRVPVAAHPYLRIGERVRIRGGALDGVEGILQSTNGGKSLVISVDPIERSLSIEIAGYNLEPVR
ncbi:MAG TPA: UpxY family transcription antiterminator [Dongiaceae bacterium]|nr:UpxY family transcription antiterminator [Dongiaceae bacterium]